MSDELQRDIKQIDDMIRCGWAAESGECEAWQRIRARLTPDRERVARAMQDAHGPMHPDFALALADAAIEAMQATKGVE